MRAPATMSSTFAGGRGGMMLAAIATIATKRKMDL
jgi:hypothetical protein